MKKYRFIFVTIFAMLLLTGCPSDGGKYLEQDYQFRFQDTNAKIGDCVMFSATLINHYKEDCGQHRELSSITKFYFGNTEIELYYPDGRYVDEFPFIVPDKAFTDKVCIEYTDLGDWSVETENVLYIAYPKQYLTMSASTAASGDKITVTSSKPFLNESRFSKERLTSMLRNGYPLVLMQKVKPFDNTGDNDYYIAHSRIMYDGKYGIPFENYVIEECSADKVVFTVPDWAISGSIDIRNENGYDKNYTFLSGDQYRNDYKYTSFRISRSDYETLSAKYPVYAGKFQKNNGETSVYQYCGLDDLWLVAGDMKEAGIFYKYFYDVYYDPADPDSHLRSAELVVTK